MASTTDTDNDLTVDGTMLGSATATTTATTSPFMDLIRELATSTEVVIIEPEEVIEEPALEEIVLTPPPLPVASAPEPEPEPELEPTPPSDLNTLARGSLVNILCLTQGAHHIITPISGSGVVVDDRGVILTNAHIAQFYLFEDFPTEDFITCEIRTGSPAQSSYKAELLYISPPWISDNAKTIVSENPMGTGEHDFAFLVIII